MGLFTVEGIFKRAEEFGGGLEGIIKSLSSEWLCEVYFYEVDDDYNRLIKQLKKLLHEYKILDINESSNYKIEEWIELEVRKINFFELDKVKSILSNSSDYDGQDIKTINSKLIDIPKTNSRIVEKFIKYIETTGKNSIRFIFASNDYLYNKGELATKI